MEGQCFSVTETQANTSEQANSTQNSNFFWINMEESSSKKCFLHPFPII